MSGKDATKARALEQRTHGYPEKVFYSTYGSVLAFLFGDDEAEAQE